MAFGYGQEWTKPGFDTSATSSDGAPLGVRDRQKHDEAITARGTTVSAPPSRELGKLGWLSRVRYFLPVLRGDDGSFRLCAAVCGDGPLRRDRAPNGLSTRDAFHRRLRRAGSWPRVEVDAGVDDGVVDDAGRLLPGPAQWRVRYEGDVILGSAGLQVLPADGLGVMRVASWASNRLSGAAESMRRCD
jgi:hypothetical protein